MGRGISLEKYRGILNQTEVVKCIGQVAIVIGLTIEAEAPSGEIGEICYIYNIDETSYIQAGNSWVQGRSDFADALR